MIITIILRITRPKILSNLFNGVISYQKMKSFQDTVEFNRKNLDENDSDYSYDAYDAYSTECIGSSYGCPELTKWYSTLL